LEYLPEHLGLRRVDCLSARARYHPDLVPDFNPARPFTFTYIVTDNTRTVHFKWRHILVLLLVIHGLSVSRETIPFPVTVPRALFFWDDL
jgi:hypothetical protein